MINIFVSHTHKDKYIVNNLKKAIQDNFEDLIVFAISSDNHYGPSAGQPWRDWIEKKIKVTDLVLIILTSNTKGKSIEWISYEAGQARAQKKQIIPIQVNKQCEIPSIISDIQAVIDDEGSDNTDEITPEILRKVLDALKSFIENLMNDKDSINLLTLVGAGPVGWLVKTLYSETQKK